MNKLSKEKRNQLVLVGLATIGVVAALCVLLLAPRIEENKAILVKIDKVRKNIAETEQVAAEAGQVELDLKVCSDRLKTIEENMPDVDRFAWLNSTLRRFNEPRYHVEMQPIANPQVSEVTSMPGFPYHQAMATLTGSAYYSDVAVFLRDFENRFPFMRLQNLSLTPGAGVNPEEREKLAFRVELIALIKYP